MTKVIVIAAMSEDRVIGKDNAIPWNIPDEMKHFRETTRGHTVIMGSRTFASLGFVPLLKRFNIYVSSKQNEFTDKIFLSGKDRDTTRLLQVTSIESALQRARESTDPDKDIFIIGGAKLYEATIPLCDEIILSVVPGTYEGDTFFPQIDDDLFGMGAFIVKEKFVIHHYFKKR